MKDFVDFYGYDFLLRIWIFSADDLLIRSIIGRFI